MVRPQPDFRPSLTVHISPSHEEVGSGMWSSQEFWITEGHELQSIVGMLYEFEPKRIDFQDQDLATTRYDVAMVPPKGTGEKAMKQAIRTALQRELGLILIQDVRRLDVYVVTAPNDHKLADRETEDTGLSIHIGGGGIEMQSGTIEDLCSALERDLDRPVIDESLIKGRYSIHLIRERKSNEQFLEQLQNELGLLVLPAQREVAMLMVRRR